MSSDRDDDAREQNRAHEEEDRAFVHARIFTGEDVARRALRGAGLLTRAARYGLVTASENAPAPAIRFTVIRKLRVPQILACSARVRAVGVVTAWPTRVAYA